MKLKITIAAIALLGVGFFGITIAKIMSDSASLRYKKQLAESVENGNQVSSDLSKWRNTPPEKKGFFTRLIDSANKSAKDDQLEKRNQFREKVRNADMISGTDVEKWFFYEINNNPIRFEKMADNKVVKISGQIVSINANHTFLVRNENGDWICSFMDGEDLTYNYKGQKVIIAGTMSGKSMKPIVVGYDKGTIYLEQSIVVE